MTDPDLITRWKQDPGAGMEALLEKYEPMLRYIIAGILKNPQDTEDCLSEVSLLLWQRLETFEISRGSLSAWLTAVARNTALNHWKSRSRRQSHLADTEHDPVDHITPESTVLLKERTALLRQAVSHMDRTEQQLFYRKYYYCQSLSQIAAEMGLSERAAEGRLYRLRQRLKQELGGDTP